MKTYRTIITLLPVFVIFIGIYFIVSDYIPDILRYVRNGRMNSNTVKYYDEVQLKPQSNESIILFWTTFFHNPWNIGTPKCVDSCLFTRDRGLVREAAAVVFHYSEMHPNDMPSFRDRGQVWVLACREPTTHVQGDWSGYVHVFNWTMWYRSDATVFWPYGNIKAVHPPRHIKPIDIKHKTKFAYASVSNRHANSKRYRILKKLFTINPLLDLFGRDYDRKCEVTSSECLGKDSLKQYFFRFALENSHCKDYVTEKFWLTLGLNLIPVVDWVPGQRPYNVPPKSYINMNDFENLNDLNDYLIKVTQDPVLYNSYFEWKRNFIVDREELCNLCKAVNNKTRKHQSIDVEAWLHSDICSPQTRWEHIKTIMDRTLFDVGV